MARIVLILAALFAAGFAVPATATVNAGDPAPAFTKNALGGGSVSLADYAGQVVVLFLFGYS